VLDQVEHRRLRPVDVLEDDDERPLACERLEQLPRCPEGFLGGGRVAAEPDRRRDPVDDDRRILAVREQLRDPVPLLLEREAVPQLRNVADDLVERPERDPLAVGQAAASHPARPTLERVEEFGGEARLADARCAEDREEVAGPLALRALERVVQDRQLEAPSDDR